MHDSVFSTTPVKPLQFWNVSRRDDSVARSCCQRIYMYRYWPVDLGQSIHNSYFHAMRAQNHMCIFSHYSSEYRSKIDWKSCYWIFLRFVKCALPAWIFSRSGGKRACMISEFLSAAVRITARWVILRSKILRVPVPVLLLSPASSVI